MKLNRTFTAVLLCLCLSVLLCGCGGGSNNSATEGSTAEPTLSHEDLLRTYEDARKNLFSSDKLQAVLEFTRNRTVGGEDYREAAKGTLLYSDLGTSKMQASSQLTLSYGPTDTKYQEYFLDGAAYSSLHGLVFTSPMSHEDYAGRYLAMAFPKAENFKAVSFEKADSGIVVTFAEPLCLESWVSSDSCIEISDIAASVTLDNNHFPVVASYEASYQCGPAKYSLSVFFTFSQEEGCKNVEIEKEKAIALEFFDAPKYLMQAAGDIFTSGSISSEVSQVISSSIHNQINTQQKVYHIWGRGPDLCATANYTVTNTDYRGISKTDTQADRFEKGTFSRITNGKNPIESTETPDHIRVKWEDKFLNGLFALNYLSGAKITQSNDFFILEFTGNEAFCASISSSLITVLPNDLDSLASSFETIKASGYLAISRQTGLPTAMGMTFHRNHVIDSVSYPLTYQMDQTLMLSSPKAHAAIHGKPETESAPVVPASPLFYEVSGANGQQMWLMGTIHAGDERTAFLPAAVYDALKNTDALAVEFDINSFTAASANDPAIQSELVKAFYYLDGTSVRDHISKDVYQTAFPAMVGAGGNSVNLDFMRPVMWASLIESHYLDYGYCLSTDKGVDQRLLRLAVQQGKEIISIESGLSQLQILANFSDLLQERILAKLLESGSLIYAKNAAEMYELWCQGSEEDLKKALTVDTSGYSEEGKKLYEEYQKALITDRNSVMVSAAKQYLESGKKVFYAVGLTHLLSEGGLIDSLRDAGYSVNAVSYTAE